MVQLTFEQLRKHFQHRRLKFTSQRHAIYKALASSVSHPTVEDLYSTLKKSHPTLSMNTVYNTLDTLKEIGIASEVSLWHDKARFDANQTTHHHLVCLHCKKIEDLFDDALDELVLSPKAKHQYHIVGCRVEFHGYCNDCKTKKEDKMKKRTPRNLKVARRLLTFVLTIGITVLGLYPSVRAQESSTALGPLPKLQLPNTPEYQAKVELGKKLFFERRLSGDGTRSCAFCHSPSSGFTTRTALGLGLKGPLGRNNPTVYNAAYNTFQFWDGRAGSLEEQALGPIQSPGEMNQNLDTMVSDLTSVPAYAEEFRKVYGKGITAQGVAEAIAAFERTVLSTNSGFDKFMAGDSKAMNESAQRGQKILQGKGRCVLCHNGPNFTDNKFHNLGVPQIGPLKEDLGRYNITKKDSDRGAFKTPTLRSVTETGPYMHDGVFNTLEEVVDFYNKGGVKNPNLDPLILPLNLKDQEKKDLVEFLKALTGEPLNIAMPKLP